MDNQAITDSLSRYFEESCSEVFSKRGCNISSTNEEARLNPSDPIGVLDAGSEELELTLILKLPFNVVALTYPGGTDIASVGEEELEDWTSELSNQILGNFKNKLLKHELTLTMGLPMTYFGADVDELTPEGGEPLLFRFSIDDEVMEAILVVEIKKDFELHEASDQDKGQNEGELELF